MPRNPNWRQPRECPRCLQLFDPQHHTIKYCGIDCQFLYRLREAPSGCIEWTGAKHQGYGQFIFRRGSNRETFVAHRYAWERANGRSIPTGLIVRHRCDNRLCCNPAHLLLGTHADNMADAVQRDRFRRGERTGGNRLKEAQVLEIIEAFRAPNRQSDRAIAEAYGVHTNTVRDIRIGRNWSWLTAAQGTSEQPR